MEGSESSCDLLAPSDHVCLAKLLKAEQAANDEVLECWHRAEILEKVVHHVENVQLSVRIVLVGATI